MINRARKTLLPEFQCYIFNLFHTNDIQNSKVMVVMFQGQDNVHIQKTLVTLILISIWNDTWKFRSMQQSLQYAIPVLLRIYISNWYYYENHLRSAKLIFTFEWINNLKFSFDIDLGFGIPYCAKVSICAG